MIGEFTRGEVLEEGVRSTSEWGDPKVDWRGDVKGLVSPERSLSSMVRREFKSVSGKSASKVRVESTKDDVDEAGGSSPTLGSVDLCTSQEPNIDNGSGVRPAIAA